MESANRSEVVVGVVSETRRDGRRFVLGLYTFIIALTGALGFVLGEVVDLGAPPRLFFVLPLPPTGPGFALYGMITVAVALGVPLGLVIYVSDRLDAETA
jgi:hypothetical protein